MNLLLFVIKSALLGVGLAMDAFSVSIANALQDPDMRRRRAFLIAGTFAFFQCLMPLAGWVIVHTAAEHFLMFRNAIPIIAFVLLLFIGGKMILETVLGDGGGSPKVSFLSRGSPPRSMPCRWDLRSPPIPDFRRWRLP